jgi:hypothetical protein
LIPGKKTKDYEPFQQDYPSQLYNYPSKVLSGIYISPYLNNIVQRKDWCIKVEIYRTFGSKFFTRHSQNSPTGGFVHGNFRKSTGIIKWFLHDPQNV